MTSYVVKANNRYEAVPQRNAVNEVMNLALRPDGSFDFDDMMKNHPEEFYVVLCLMYYQLTKDASKISPTEIYVKPAVKYEALFKQLEEPIFLTIKHAVASGEHYSVLQRYKIKSFFMYRAVLADLPEALKEKALLAARTTHGDDYDTTALENNEVHLDTIINRTGYNIVSFSILTFEFN